MKSINGKHNVMPPRIPTANDLREGDRVAMVGGIDANGFSSGVYIYSTKSMYLDPAQKYKEVWIPNKFITKMDRLPFESGNEYPFLNIGPYLTNCKQKDAGRLFHGEIGKVNEDGETTIRSVFWSKPEPDNVRLNDPWFGRAGKIREKIK